MYTPPLKGFIFPSKNPFFNGQITDYVDQLKQSSNNKKNETSNLSKLSYKIPTLIKD
jgi:hypothetical protein